MKLENATRTRLAEHVQASMKGWDHSDAAVQAAINIALCAVIDEQRERIEALEAKLAVAPAPPQVTEYRQPLPATTAPGYWR